MRLDVVEERDRGRAAQRLARERRQQQQRQPGNGRNGRACAGAAAAACRRTGAPGGRAGTAARPAPARNRALAARSAAGYSPLATWHSPEGTHRVHTVGWPGSGQWDLGPMGNMSGELAKAFRYVHIEPRILWPALTVALGYYLAARLGFAFTLQPHPISTLWPPNALLMAALLLDAGALVVVAARRRAAGAPARRAAERRADRDGARLVRQQLQRGADRRGAGACLRAGAAAPRFAAQRRHLPRCAAGSPRRSAPRSSTRAW